MKFNYFLSAIVGLSIVAAPVNAADWVHGGDNWYFDRETIRRDGNKVVAWINYIAATSEEKREYKHLEKFDCESRTLTLLARTIYNPDGRSEVISLPKDRQSFSYIPPGSHAEAKLKILCRTR